MPRSLLSLLALLVLLVVATLAHPQSAHREDLPLVETLRELKDNDLALALLERLAKDAPSPDLLKELPLEFAVTRLRVASDEPDTNRRLALYRQARGDLEAFIAKNAGSPRLADANLELARALNLLGQAE